MVRKRALYVLPTTLNQLQDDLQEKSNAMYSAYLNALLNVVHLPSRLIAMANRNR